jgi:hypothetical protein
MLLEKICYLADGRKKKNKEKNIIYYYENLIEVARKVYSTQMEIEKPVVVEEVEFN